MHPASAPGFLMARPPEAGDNPDMLPEGRAAPARRPASLASQRKGGNTVIIGKPSAANRTVLGRPFLATPGPQPADESALPVAGPMDRFQAMVDLTDLCRRTDGQIAAFGEQLARNPQAVTDDMRTGIFTGFAGAAQSVLDRLPEGPDRRRAGDFARKEGFRLLDRAIEAEDLGRQRFVTSQLDRLQRAFADDAAVDPAKMEDGVQLFSELVDAADLSPTEARELKRAGHDEIRKASAVSSLDSSVVPPVLEIADGRFGEDVEDLNLRLGNTQPFDNRHDQFTADDQATLRSLAQTLRDNGAPDAVIETTLRDVAEQAVGLRRTAMEPFTATALTLGALALTALAASSLDAQRRRVERSGRRTAGDPRFDRLIEAIRRPHEAAIDGDGGDEETDRLPVTPENEPVAAAAQTEPPPNPEDDPLFDLMVQTITGQIVEQAVRERPEVRAEVRQHARELLPQIRELYPDGIGNVELERIVPLGKEPDQDKFRPGEVVTGVLLERTLGAPLERSPHEGVDWIDSSNTTYDGILGNMPAQHYSIEAARKSIREHVNKSVDHVVVDLHRLSEAQANEVEDFINTELSAADFSKVIILR